MLFPEITAIVHHVLFHLPRRLRHHYDLNTIQVFNHLGHGSLEDFRGTLYAEGQPCEPVTTNWSVKGA